MSEPATTIALIQAQINANQSVMDTLTVNYSNYLYTYNTSYNALVATNQALQEDIDVIQAASTDATVLGWIKSALGLA